MGDAEVLDELLVGGRLFHRVEILAVQVLDQGLLDTGDVGRRPHQSRNGLVAGPAGRPPPALTGDELVLLIAELTDQDGLQDTEFPNGSGQGRQRFFIEMGPRLMLVGPDVGDRDLQEGRAAIPDDLVGDERAESSTQPAAASHH